MRSESAVHARVLCSSSAAAWQALQSTLCCCLDLSFVQQAELHAAPRDRPGKISAYGAAEQVCWQVFDQPSGSIAHVRQMPGWCIPLTTWADLQNALKLLHAGPLMTAKQGFHNFDAAIAGA